MVKHGCGLTLRAPMFKLSEATKLNEFEFDARSAKRAFEVSGVLHARFAHGGGGDEGDRSFNSIYVPKFYSARASPRGETVR